MKLDQGLKKLPTIVLLAALSFLLAACTVDSSPRIDSFNVERVLDQADTVTLSAKVSDPNNDLKSVTVRWGDGSSEQVNSNFQTIQLTHSYTELNKTYTIELEAEDILAAKVMDSKEIGVSSVARSCQSITGIEFCYDVQPDLLTAKVSLKAFDNTLFEDTLSVSNPNVEFDVPLATGVSAKVKLTGDFSASGIENSVRVQVFTCTFFNICTGAIADETIVF